MIDKFRSTKGYKIAGYSGFGFIGIIVFTITLLFIISPGWNRLLPAFILFELPTVIFWYSLIIHITIILQYCNSYSNNLNAYSKIDTGYIILLILTILSIFIYPMLHLPFKKLFLF